MGMNIVLVNPEIPHNTGSIARTCALTGASLHLIRPLGFSTGDKHLKRAGLDYWHLVDVHYYDDFYDLVEKFPEGKFFYATTKAEQYYSDVKYEDNTFIVFGQETKGLSKEILEGKEKEMIKIPMRPDIPRSLNLSNAANIILYEAFRQLDFPFVNI